jgi:hypothetical protein
VTLTSAVTSRSARRLVGSALAGAAAGVVVGLAARLAMRTVALGLVDASQQPPTFTIAGTLSILVTGAIVGAPLALAYRILASRLPGPLVLRGLAYGALVLMIFGPLFFVGTDEFLSNGRVLVFLWLFPIYGVSLALLAPPAERIAARLPVAAQAIVLLATAAGTGLILVGIVGIALQSAESRGIATLALFASWIVLAVAYQTRGMIRLRSRA